MKMTRLEGYRLSPQQSNVWRLRQELSHSNWVGLLSIEGTLDVDKLSLIFSKDIYYSNKIKLQLDKNFHSSIEEAKAKFLEMQSVLQNNLN